MAKERYVSFGEQVGAVSAFTLAPDAVTKTLRNTIWNRTRPLLYAREWDTPAHTSAMALLLRMAWDKGWDVDQHRGSNDDRCALVVKSWLLDETSWHEVYEFVQSFPRWAKLNESDRKIWEEFMDEALFQERSLYRFIDHKLTPIAADDERAAVAEAVAQTGKYALAAEHVGKALAKFGDRPTPDYENAAKEAALALESALKVATGEDNVGDAARAFRDTYGVHPALSDIASKLFGYASDRDGVRHAKTKRGKSVEFDEAKLVIVYASAWVKFIAAKAP